DPETQFGKLRSEDDGEGCAPATAAEDGQVHCGLRGAVVRTAICEGIRLVGASLDKDRSTGGSSGRADSDVPSNSENFSIAGAAPNSRRQLLGVNLYENERDQAHLPSH